MICKLLAGGIIEVVGAGLAAAGFGGSDFFSGDDLSLSLSLFFASSNSFLFCFNSLGSAPVKFLPSISRTSSTPNARPAAALIPNPTLPVAGMREIAANAPSTFSPLRKFIPPLTPVIILPIPDKSPPPPDFGPLVPPPAGGAGGLFPPKIPDAALPNPLMTAWNGLIINPPIKNFPMFATSPVIVLITLPIPILIIRNTPPAIPRVLITEFLISSSCFLSPS